ncbi:hypothetical protein ACGFX2_26870 [Streptomyces goshikiensis]|uniref:hypothetical protein n=1 Tax=Streptomyces goshikiensis TaxID=1942 RepID=UPI003721D238
MCGVQQALGRAPGTAAALWQDKDALGIFLDVVRRSETFAALDDSLERSEVRPAKPSFYGVKCTGFQN